MESGVNFAEMIAQGEAHEPQRAQVAEKEGESGVRSQQAHELGLWLLSLRSFFNLRYHPLKDTDRAQISKRNFINEARIAQEILLRTIHLTHALSGPDASASLVEAKRAKTIDPVTSAERSTTAASPYPNGLMPGALVMLSDVLTDFCALGEMLAGGRAVSLPAWASFGKIVVRELDRSPAAAQLAHAARHHSSATLQPSLIALAERLPQDTLAADMLTIFSDLARLLDQLRFIEAFQRRDVPLKQTLPIFTLVHEETLALLDFIATRAFRTEGLDGTVFDALDSTGYAIGMELRKVFLHELIDLSSIREPPRIYARVENAHGLLRDSFQQSTIALAQVFDPMLDSARLFNAARIRLEQSLMLRRDLWTLLELVRRAEKDRAQRPIAPLLERLTAFRNGSLRYLMYKDWEAYERFVEEVGAARGAGELTPVLHRFATYLEALFGQINMRAVLADHPFDYPPLVD